MNLCRACGEDFHSVPTFDEHRVGVHEYTYREGIQQDPPKYDGRRCLTLVEMEQLGWRKNPRGRWQRPDEGAVQPELFEGIDLT